MGDLFEQRIGSFKGEGELTAFNLAAVAEALDTVAALSEQNTGGETVEKRIGEFRSWDPDVFKVDRDAEDGFVRRLEQLGRPIVMLSEEAGRKEINSGAPGELLYCVSDPFDGSYLFKHGIPDFWYCTLAFYGADFQPVCCAVGDAVHRRIAFADARSAFVAELDGALLTHRFKLDAAYRAAMGRPPVTELEPASIESYAMKPRKFLLPLVDRYRQVLEPFKFFLPNGGPCGFVDVAEGKIDCYFAAPQPFTEVFSGVFVAMQAGAVVTDFDGNEVRFTDDINTVLNVVVTTNEALHQKVLEKVALCR
jgi:fructose-1,6-bisphosphatase/inositol monophosphatase family enzyme